MKTQHKNLFKFQHLFLKFMICYKLFFFQALIFIIKDSANKDIICWNV